MKIDNLFQRSKGALVVALVCLLGACASNTPAPDALMTEAEMRIETAEESNVGNEAPAELRAARNQLSGARRAMREENYAEAERDLEKAIASADLAIMKSRSERMERAAEEVRETLETLRMELNSAQAS